MTNNMIEFPSTDMYWISYNNDEMFYHYGVTHSDQVTENSLNMMEEFENEDDYKSRGTELGLELSNEPDLNNNRFVT